MNKIIFNVNNGGQLVFSQSTNDCDLTVSRIENGITEYKNTIPAGDMVMLLNMYNYIKENDIQNDFINPYGNNKE